MTSFHFSVFLPSFLCHLMIVPFSIVGDSDGISTFIAAETHRDTAASTHFTTQSEGSQTLLQPLTHNVSLTHSGVFVLFCVFVFKQFLHCVCVFLCACVCLCACIHVCIHVHMHKRALCAFFWSLNSISVYYYLDQHQGMVTDL